MTRMADIYPAETAMILAKQLNGRLLASLSAVELKQLTRGFMGAWSAALREADRRKSKPRGRAKLRLVADLLTQAGHNAVRPANAKQTREKGHDARIVDAYREGAAAAAMQRSDGFTSLYPDAYKATSNADQAIYGGVAGHAQDPLTAPALTSNAATEAAKAADHQADDGDGQ